MAEYQLYCFAQSGNCYRAALMLSVIGAAVGPDIAAVPLLRSAPSPLSAFPSALCQVSRANSGQHHLQCRPDMSFEEIAAHCDAVGAADGGTY